MPEKKKFTKKELETKRLKKLWRSLGYHKYMPFGNFRILATRNKIKSKL
jgi:hypothetical protein